MACGAGIAKCKSGYLVTWFHKENAASASRAEAKAILTAINLAGERNWENLLLLIDFFLIPAIQCKHFNVPLGIVCCY